MSKSNEPEERISDTLARAEALDRIRDGEPGWIRDEIEKLWNNVEAFEEGELYEVPDGVAEEDYVLFKLGLLFGTDYEHHYPRGRGDE